MTDTPNSRVIVETNKGSFTIELYPNKAPDTVANFLKHVEANFYDGTIFHRVIKGFMVQGGGFIEGMRQKPTLFGEIENEAPGSDLPNDPYFVAMARTSSPHSASCQFFVNTASNKFLNHTAKTAQGFGYCVFGKVVEGMDVIDAMCQVKTGRVGFHDDVPQEAIVINSAKLEDDDGYAAAQAAKAAYPFYRPNMFGSVPVHVRAAVWNKNGDHPLDYAHDTDGLENGEMRTFTGAERKEKDWEGSIVRRYRHPRIDGETDCPHCGAKMHDHGWIDVSDENRIVCPGDYVVSADAKSFFAVKPMTFKALFKPV